MHKSKVLQKLRAGEVCSSLKVNSVDPRIVEITALCAPDAIWLDMEHCPNTIAQTEAQIVAAKLQGVDVYVRVPRSSYSNLVWPLEADATGIMVPHVMDASDARDIVRMTRFMPVGRRPIDGGNADGDFGLLPAKEYCEQSNREKFVILQIEDPEAMEQLDEIAAVPGYDMLFFGPGDYSHALGLVGETESPEVVRARKMVAKAAQKNGKFAGTVGSAETAAELIAMGYQFINLGADGGVLHSGFTAMLSKWSMAKANPNP